MTLANSAKEIANAISPTSMTGRRPQRSLRRPQKAEEKIQIVADTAKIDVTCSGERPSCREIGGRMVNSTDCPAPMHTRLTNRIPNARRRSAGGVASAKAVRDVDLLADRFAMARGIDVVGIGHGRSGSESGPNPLQSDACVKTRRLRSNAAHECSRLNLICAVSLRPWASTTVIWAMPSPKGA